MLCGHIRSSRGENIGRRRYVPDVQRCQSELNGVKRAEQLFRARNSADTDTEAEGGEQPNRTAVTESTRGGTRSIGEALAAEVPLQNAVQSGADDSYTVAAPEPDKRTTALSRKRGA